jgi:hypothetical protein
MSFPYPYLGPIAPENNPPINPQYYEPSRFVISALTLGIVTNITTSVPHNYVVGQQIRVLIPPFYGTYQISGQQGYVISVPSSTQVIVDINSSGANAFVSSPSYGPTQPQIVAIGDVNSGVINSNGRKGNGTFIPGSFINISPN